MYHSSGSGEALDALKEFIKNNLANNDETMNEVFKITGVKSGKGDISEGYTSDWTPCIKGFDRCKFDILFGKFVERNVPVVVVRVLLFVYEEQQA